MIELNTIDEAVHAIFLVLSSNDEEAQRLFINIVESLIDRKLTREEQAYARDELARLILNS
jgi:hypothetical protein